MVFEFTMAAEEIPLDPRILVRAQHRVSKRVTLKCRFPCSHEDMHGEDGRMIRWVMGKEWRVAPHRNRWICANRPDLLSNADGQELFYEDKFEQKENSVAYMDDSASQSEEDIEEESDDESDEESEQEGGQEGFLEIEEESDWWSDY